MAPAVVDPKLIEQLSAMLLDKSPVKLPRHRALIPKAGCSRP